MPGGNGTGPMGLGPMTGRGAGFCAGYSVPGFMNPVGGRLGMGFGWGRGLGWGRGFGWGRWGGFYPYGYRVPYLGVSPYYPYGVPYGYRRYW